jgi:uncharacterized protein with ParB-like and HNH nuclease domain
MNDNEKSLDDVEIVDIGDEKEEEATPLNYDIHIWPTDYTLEVLHKLLIDNEIIIPKFQRGFVWNISQASRLIDSFMMGLPVPPIFLYVQQDERYLIIDGRQRLQTISYYFKGIFGEADGSSKLREFKLEGINKSAPWFNKKFSELDEADQRKLKNKVLRAIVVRQIHPSDENTSIYHIFERLNTGGVQLNDQEIRNCVYYGKLNDLLLELNKHQTWRKILGKSRIDNRQNDVQLILRYMSLFHASSDYTKPMKEFLNKFMSKNRNPSPDFLVREKNRFTQTCDNLVKHLGERPFNPKGPLNPSVFDSIFIAFAKHYESIPQNIRDRFTKLKADVNFQDYTSNATTDVEIVKKRLKLAEDILFG